jgi:peptide/nickel transport system ATP-binding protein
MQKQLEIQDLCVDFWHDGEYHSVIRNVSYTVECGKTLGIVGESGSGKSVSSMSVMQLLPPPPKRKSTGHIWFYMPDGSKVDLLSLSEKEIMSYRGKHISMIFQEPMTSLNPVHTCGKQVMEALKTHESMTEAEAYDKALALFEEVKLPRPDKIMNSYPHEVSGGQKQRVMIAMALACKPSLLIADEPTTALDVTIQKGILDLLKKMQQKYGMTIIFISHDFGVISQICDDVLVLYKGEVVEQNTAAEVLKAPKHPYTKGLLACRPPMEHRPLRLPTVADYLSDKDFHQTIETKAERAARHKEIYSQAPLLEVRNLSVEYPLKKNIFGKVLQKLVAVDDVSFEVYNGETLGLVGESGCGKTTLGRAILQLIEHSSGKVIYKGMDLNKLSAKTLRQLRPKIQIIFQDPYSSLNPRISVGNAIMEPMKVFKIGKSDAERKERVIKILNEVGLEAQHFSRYPHEFSGGQRQRVCIARALALEPELVICDESVSALDVSVQAQVLNLLNELKTKFNFTYIFISHDLSVVKFLSDRMLIMQKGKIIEMGDADDIYSNPKNEYTQNLIASVPKVE